MTLRIANPRTRGGSVRPGNSSAIGSGIDRQNRVPQFEPGSSIHVALASGKERVLYP
jgi:hypothetical protein